MTSPGRFAAILLTAALLPATGAHAQSAVDRPVGITPELMSVTVQHRGKAVEIKRNQNTAATVDPAFARTSRPCPPFCIQPMNLAPGVETIGELELLGYLDRQWQGDDSILVIDSRTPDWVRRGTIPGATNIPWTALNARQGATTETIMGLLTDVFRARLKEGKGLLDVDEAIVAGNVEDVIDYAEARTLVLFCNGMWCGQSPANIRTLLDYGYPADKLKWYRGGMQAWEILGFNTVR